MRLNGTRQILTLIAGLGTCFAASAASAPKGADPHSQWKLIETYCFDCHNTEDWAGSVAFDTMSVDTIPEEAKVWETTVKKLKGGLMPPAGSAQPSREEALQLASFLETTLDTSLEKPYVGHIPLRRLNRREYANAIRDLIGLEINPATYLPDDEVKDGFDTDAAGLRVTPTFLDQAVSSAREIVPLIGRACTAETESPTVREMSARVARPSRAISARPF